MAATFPLLNLSPAVSQHVLQFMKFPDLFDLSQCSKRAFNLVKNTFKSTPSDLIVSIYTSSRVAIATIDETLFGEAVWNFYDARNPLRIDLEDPTTYNVNGLLVKFCRTDVREIPAFDCTSDHSIQELMKFCEHLMNLFNATIHELHIDCRMTKYLKQLQSVEAFRTSRFVSLDQGIVPHDGLRQILTGFETKSLLFSCGTKPNFILDESITIEKIRADSNSWITDQVLRNLNFKQASFHDVTLTNETLHSVVKRWLEGSNTRMEYIYASIPLPSPRYPKPRLQEQWDLSKILEGFATIPGADKRHDVVRFSPLLGPYDVPYAEGLDLKRESDGMLATAVVFNGTMDIRHFLFEVWQVPDPNVVVDDE